MGADVAKRIRMGRPRWRSGVLATLIAGAGCGSPTDGTPELPNGDYRLRLATPQIGDPFGTPSWMGATIEVDFTRSADDASITDSSGDVVATGTAQRFELTAEGWILEFALAGREDGFHYWSVEISEDSCAMPLAVDADIGPQPGGIRVPFAICTIRRR